MLFRIDPKGPPQAYVTWRINSPADRTVVAACKEAGCLAWRNGWESKIDERNGLGQNQALYIRTQSGRTFTERKTGDGLTIFRFAPYQRCFAEHHTRPETFMKVGGDWRANPRGERRVHARPDDWVEDMAETLESIKAAQERG